MGVRGRGPAEPHLPAVLGGGRDGDRAVDPVEHGGLDDDHTLAPRLGREGAAAGGAEVAGEPQADPGQDEACEGQDAQRNPLGH